LHDLRQQWERDREALECQLSELKAQKTEAVKRAQKAEIELNTATEKVKMVLKE
jgi:hypothetical protein